VSGSPLSDFSSAVQVFPKFQAFSVKNWLFLTIQRPLSTTDRGLSALDRPLSVTKRGLCARERGLSGAKRSLSLPDRGLSTLERSLPVRDRPLSGAEKGLSPANRFLFLMNLTAKPSPLTP
jgi:hypothetical protein